MEVVFLVCCADALCVAYTALYDSCSFFPLLHLSWTDIEARRSISCFLRYAHTCCHTSSPDLLHCFALPNLYCFALGNAHNCAPFFSYFSSAPSFCGTLPHPPYKPSEIKTQRLIKKCDKTRKEKKGVSVAHLHLYPLHNSINQFLWIRQYLRRTSFCNPCSRQSL
jgi:hypothetical protein